MLRYYEHMRLMFFNNKYTVTALLSAALFSLPLASFAVDQERVDQLLSELAASTPDTYEQIEDQIRTEWGKSGSAAIDLLLERGRTALDEDDVKLALNHFTALTDHAPEFAQGWNYKATALYRLDLLGPAIDSIEKALRLDPKNFDALTGLAVILEELGYAKDALEAYEAVRAIHPHRENISTAIERLNTQVRGQDI